MNIPLPAFLRRVFDTFPLLINPSANLPDSSPSSEEREKLILYIYGEGPSHHPSSLCMQTLLHTSERRFDTRSSNAHASSTNRLPFLLLPGGIQTVVAERIPDWIFTDEPKLETESKAFLTLVNTSLRNAWLYTVYLEPRNFQHIAMPLFIDKYTAWPASLLVGKSFRDSAYKAITESRGGSYISRPEIYADAERAWAALSSLLNGRAFFGAHNEDNTEKPGLLDAAVFSFTYQFLTLELDPTEADVRTSLQQCSNLSQHCDRIIKMYYKKART